MPHSFKFVLPVAFTATETDFGWQITVDAEAMKMQGNSALAKQINNTDADGFAAAFANKVQQLVAKYINNVKPYCR